MTREAEFFAADATVQDAAVLIAEQRAEMHRPPRDDAVDLAKAGDR